MWRLARESNRHLVLQTLQGWLKADPDNAIWTGGKPQRQITAANTNELLDLEGLIAAATYCYLGLNKGRPCFPHGGIVRCSSTTSHLIFLADSAHRLAKSDGLRDSAQRIALFYFMDYPDQRVFHLAPPHCEKQTIPPIHRSELSLDDAPSKA